jgi:hypothetical protein
VLLFLLTVLVFQLLSDLLQEHCFFILVLAVSGIQLLLHKFDLFLSLFELLDAALLQHFQ